MLLQAAGWVLLATSLLLEESPTKLGAPAEIGEQQAPLSDEDDFQGISYEKPEMTWREQMQRVVAPPLVHLWLGDEGQARVLRPPANSTRGTSGVDRH